MDFPLGLICILGLIFFPFEARRVSSPTARSSSTEVLSPGTISRGGAGTTPREAWVNHYWGSKGKRGNHAFVLFFSFVHCTERCLGQLLLGHVKVNREIGLKRTSKESGRGKKILRQNRKTNNALYIAFLLVYLKKRGLGLDLKDFILYPRKIERPVPIIIGAKRGLKLKQKNHAFVHFFIFKTVYILFPSVK